MDGGLILSPIRSVEAKAGYQYEANTANKFPQTDVPSKVVPRRLVPLLLTLKHGECAERMKPQQATVSESNRLRLPEASRVDRRAWTVR